MSTPKNSIEGKIEIEEALVEDKELAFLIHNSIQYSFKTLPEPTRPAITNAAGRRKKQGSSTESNACYLILV